MSGGTPRPWFLFHRSFRDFPRPDSHSSTAHYTTFPPKTRPSDSSPTTLPWGPGPAPPTNLGPRGRTLVTLNPQTSSRFAPTGTVCNGPSGFPGTK